MLDERRLPRTTLAGDQDDRCPASLRRGQGPAEDGALGVASHQHPVHAPSLPSPPPGRKVPGAARLGSMGELSLEEAGTDRHRTVTWTDPLVGAALARDLSGLEYLRAIADGRAPAAPIASLLGMSIVSADKGQVIFGLDVGEHL